MDPIITNNRNQLNRLLALSLGFNVLLIVFRIWHTGGGYGFLFLLWNQFLALVPFLLSSWLIARNERTRRPLVLLMTLVLWLLFLPNASYIVTDLFHLRVRAGVPIWLDLMLLSTAAWNGLLLGFVSMYDIQRLFAQKFNAAVSWLIIIATSFLSAFGVYLGRYLRYNSWDLITHPEELFFDIFEILFQPTEHLRAWGVTLALGTFLLIGYSIIRSLIGLHQPSKTSY